MSKMSDIHAAASEIDTTDADAVQALADSLAAERYAADVAIYAEGIRAVTDPLSAITGTVGALADDLRTLADDVAAERYAADIAAYADAVRRAIESMDADTVNGADAGPDCVHYEESHNVLISADGAQYCAECVRGARRIAGGDEK